MLRAVELAGPAGKMEALLNEGAADAPYAALVCHPHPRGGGNLNNKVVYHAMKVMNAPEWGFAWPVLRFNFRGTGLSDGQHHGKAETGDVLAAMEWLENEYNRPVVVAGFSFGAAMALLTCCTRRPNHAGVKALAALGLPTHADGCDYRYAFLSDCTLPKLFVSGGSDEYAPSAQLSEVAEAAAEPKSVVFIPGADHFFTGQLQAMQQALAGWLKEKVQ